jgi:hypothetical protein
MQPNPNPYPVLGQGLNMPVPLPPQAYIPLRQMRSSAPMPVDPFATAQSPSVSYSPVREEGKENLLRTTQPFNDKSSQVVKLPENFAFTPGCGRKSAFVMCPACKFQGMTVIEYKSSDRTYGAGVILCCLFWPIACVPCCIKQCKYAVHKCPHCQYIITETPPFE